MPTPFRTFACLLPLLTLLRAGSALAADVVERGGYLVEALGCHDCHTPLRMGPNGPYRDPAGDLSGHPKDVVMPPPPPPSGPWTGASAATNTAFAGPWGVSYAANITPDIQTGIGAWQADDFVKAMRTGQHLGVGRRILPPMPTNAIGHLDDTDLKAMYAYLMARRPVANLVPEPGPRPALR